MMGRVDIRFIILLVFILIVINWIGSLFPLFIDLTEDKRYTVSNSTIDLIEAQQAPIDVEVLFAGDYPAGYKRLQNAEK